MSFIVKTRLKHTPFLGFMAFKELTDGSALILLFFSLDVYLFVPEGNTALYYMVVKGWK